MQKKVKKVVSIVTILAMMLTLFSASFGTVSAKSISAADILKTTSDSSLLYDFGLPSESKGGVILHAWNWYFNDVTERMEEIARAGYKTVQISPVQLSKEDGEYLDIRNNWWKLYQPLNFSVGNFLGTKEEFSKMCTTAHKYGVNIIVDVVTNHMSGGDSGANGNCDKNINLTVEYNGEKYNIIDNKIFWHDPSVTNSDNSRREMTQGSIGMPDLNTSMPQVQELVLGLLKECVDLGADGFRYDALKHIETDCGVDVSSGVSSDFWKNTLNAVNEYTKTDYEGKKLYHYGEVIAPVYPNTQGGKNTNSASILNDGYLKYFDGLTDVGTGYWVREDIKDNIINRMSPNSSSDAFSAGGAGAYCGTMWYGIKNASDMVLWVESHDTYAEDTYENGGNGAGVLTSKPLSENDIKLGWAMINTRAYVTTLFFVRPLGFSDAQSSNFGADGATTLYLNKDIVALNQFHNYFYGETYESVVAPQNGRTYSVERYNSKTSTAGIVITNVGTSEATLSVSTSKFANGTYKDIISGRSYTVSGGKVTGKLPAKSFIMLYSKSDVSNHSEPKATVSQEGGQFEDSLDLTLGLENATSGTYAIGNGTPVSFTEGTDIIIGEDVANGEYVAVTLTASNSEKTVTDTYVFTKCEPVTEAPEVYFIYSGTQKPTSVKFNFDDCIKRINTGNAKSIDGTFVEMIPATENLEKHGFDLGINYVMSKYDSSENHYVYKCSIPNNCEYGKLNITLKVGSSTKTIPTGATLSTPEGYRITHASGSTTTWVTADFNLYNKTMVCFDYRKGYAQPKTLDDYNLIIKNSFAANVSADGGEISNEYEYIPFDTSIPDQQIDYTANRKQFLLGSVIKTTAYDGENEFDGWYNADTNTLITNSKSIILPVYQDVNIKAVYSTAATGDLNGDGIINILDAYIITSKSIFTDAEEKAGDIDKNGVLDSNDAVSILEHLADVNKLLAAYNLNVTSASNGTVAKTYNGIYVKNYKVSLSAVPEKHYVFAGWKNSEGAVVSSDANYSFNLQSDTDLTAVFEEAPTYTVNIVAGENGTVSNEISNETLYSDDSVTVTAVPDEGYHFKGWYDNDADEYISTDETLSLDKITSDINYTAVFKNTYTVTVKADNGGIVSSEDIIVDKENELVFGTSVELTATPAEGYEFAGWYTDKGQLSLDDVYTFTVACDITITAKFNSLGKTVYFYNESDWTDVRIHAWETGGEAYAEWGSDEAKMTKVTEGVPEEYTHDVYSFTFDASSNYDNVIFYNTKTSAQTDNLTIYGGDETGKNNMYCCIDDKWIIFGEEHNHDDQPSDEMTIYFSNNRGWSNVKIYAYKSGTSFKEMTTWAKSPTMTYVTTNSMGEKIYKYTFSTEYDTVIFHNGSGDQTVNIAYSKYEGNDQFYTVSKDSSGSWTVGSCKYSG